MSATMSGPFGNVCVVDIEDTVHSNKKSKTTTKCATSKEAAAAGPARDAVSEGRGSDFKVRSASFLKTGKKAPSGHALLSLASADVVVAPGGIAHAADWKQATLNNFSERQFLITNFRCPTISFVLCFVFPTEQNKKGSKMPQCVC